MRAPTRNVWFYFLQRLNHVKGWAGSGGGGGAVDWRRGVVIYCVCVCSRSPRWTSWSCCCACWRWRRPRTCTRAAAARRRSARCGGCGGRTAPTADSSDTRSAEEACTEPRPTARRHRESARALETRTGRVTQQRVHAFIRCKCSTANVAQIGFWQADGCGKMSRPLPWLSLLLHVSNV
jgi:hypothetical protein